MSHDIYKKMLGKIEQLDPELYEKGSGYFKNRSIVAPSGWTMRETSAVVLRQLPLSAPVMDLGCGAGVWLAELWSKGFRNLNGVDTGHYIAVGHLKQALDHAGIEAKLTQVDFLYGGWGKHMLVTAFDFLSAVRRGRDQAGRPKKLPPAEVLYTMACGVMPGGFMAFDWYIDEQARTARTCMRPKEVEEICIHLGLKRYMILTRWFNQRKIGFYVFRKP